jgi:hypothetical protein
MNIDGRSRRSSKRPTSASGGDTVPLPLAGLRTVTVLNLCSGVSSPGGHALEVIYGTEEPPVAPKIRARDVATGAELGNGTDQSAQSVRAIAYWDPIP